MCLAIAPSSLPRNRKVLRGVPEKPAQYNTTARRQAPRADRLDARENSGFAYYVDADPSDLCDPSDRDWSVRLSLWRGHGYNEWVAQGSAAALLARAGGKHPWVQSG
jgi:hypothetical protein